MSKLTDFRIVYQEVKTAIRDYPFSKHNSEFALATHHNNHYCADAVSVEIRRWSRYGGEYGTSAIDIVLHCKVIADGQVRMDECSLLDPDLNDAGLQRIGIARFDALVRDHPNLARAEE